jgi:hypothetical protein
MSNTPNIPENVATQALNLGSQLKSKGVDSEQPSLPVPPQPPVETVYPPTPPVTVPVPLTKDALGNDAVAFKKDNLYVSQSINPENGITTVAVDTNGNGKFGDKEDVMIVASGGDRIYGTSQDQSGALTDVADKVAELRLKVNGLEYGDLSAKEVGDFATAVANQAIEKSRGNGGIE